ncbi:hypothetical protein D3C78_396090 [compost metagenome]
MIVDTPGQTHQLPMIASSDAGGHLVQGRAIASHLAFVQFDCHRFILLPPAGLMDHAGGTLAQHLGQAHMLPIDAWAMPGIFRRAERRRQRIAGIGQPGQARHLQQPVRQRLQLVGGNAHQFKLLAACEAGGQRL